ncbi:non-hydrolyzing UDP-N-acetylglucosamine 2-epimerase [Thermodesulfobacteriota bacterium]
MKILLVFGTRPEAIKMAPLIKAFEDNKALFVTKVCVTAQHREMLDQALDFFEIRSDYDLDIMTSEQDLYDITTSVLNAVKGVLTSFNPDVVLVQGDTTTTFATALAAFYQKIKVGHVEAGLRTGNLYSPWPEEANRKLTTSIVQYHFAPTKINRQNLLNEGVKPEQILVTGNTVVDALSFTLDKIQNDPQLKKSIKKQINSKIGIDVYNSKFILVTGHRRENFGEGFLNICTALKRIVQACPDLNIVYPVHLNPNVRKPVHQILSNVRNIYLTDPLDYLAFTYLMMKSWLVLTDSGGIQEEAPSLGKPVLVMRDTTERPEGVNAGIVKIVGSESRGIINAVNELYMNESAYRQMSVKKNPYGSGIAANLIVDFFKSLVSKTD